MRPRVPLEQRFWRFVVKGTPDSCWTWTGAKTEGYGTISAGAEDGCRTLLAHRVAWEMEHGPVPWQRTLRHTCENAACVNPAHLTLGRAEDCLPKTKTPTEGGFPKL